MSADTTVLVVRTERRDGREGYEYRVRCVQNAEDLVDVPDYPSRRPVVSRWFLLRNFADATVYYDGNLAQAEARRIEREMGFGLEYGIRWHRFNGVHFPHESIARSQGSPPAVRRRR